MSNQKVKAYESTVMRIAGNVAGQVMRMGEAIDPEWVDGTRAVRPASVRS